MAPLAKKNIYVHCLCLHERIYFFSPYMLIKNYPTCPTILPHANKARQDAIYSKKIGRILFPVSYLFNSRCILPIQRMAF